MKPTRGTDFKHIYPKSGLERDCIGRWGRKYLAFVHNVRGIKKFVKNKMNRRMRKIGKYLTTQQE